MLSKGEIKLKRRSWGIYDLFLIDGESLMKRSASRIALKILYNTGPISVDEDQRPSIVARRKTKEKIERTKIGSFSHDTGCRRLECL